MWGDMPEPGMAWEDMWNELTGFVLASVENPHLNDAKDILEFMHELKRRRREPIARWMKEIMKERNDS